MKVIVAGLATTIAFFINLALIPVIIRLSHRFKWYDLPDKRKIHTGLIPRLGGPGIFLAFMTASLLTILLFAIMTRGKTAMGFSLNFIAPFTGILLIHLFGLYDDFRNLRAILKFLLQLLAAGIVTSGGYLIRSLTIPYLGSIPLGVLAYPVTIIWIVGISNAVNLIDGMDGLAGGIGAFAALSMGIISLIQGNAAAAILSFALFGAVLGFLFYNFPPARIFMGDSGSLLLGFTLAVIPLMGIPKASAFGTLIVPVTLLMIPIIDTAAAILRRIRQKRPIISADKEHIHHKLLDMGFSERQILGVIYGFCLYLSIVSVTSVILPKEINVYLVLIVWGGCMLGYWFLNYLDAKKQFFQRKRAEDSDKSENQENRLG